ncbi:MAG: hypothetical protein Q9164_001101 [Protoblastenia rupestris]
MYSDRENAISPFLRLPQEIKAMIYEQVCGNHIIHIIEPPNFARSAIKSHTRIGRLGHQICIANYSETEAQKSFLDADPINVKSHFENNNGRHNRCFLPNARHEIWTWKSRKIDLALLRVSRQIYHEAKHVPTAFNTFAFDCPYTFSHFVQYMTKTSLKCHLAVRRVLLQIQIRHPMSESLWAAAITGPLQSLQNLRSADINVAQSFCECCMRHCSYELRESNRLWMAILGMKIMALKEATVVIEDKDLLGDYRPGSWMDFRGENGWGWTLKEKQDWAKVVRRTLLGGNEQDSTSTVELPKTGG